MGMHRDGARWNLPEEVIDDRRRVFWEAHAADIFQVSHGLTEHFIERRQTVSHVHLPSTHTI